MFGDMFMMSADTNKPHSSRSIGGLSTLGTGTLLCFLPLLCLSFLCHLHLLNTMLTIELPYLLICPCLSHYPYCISQQNHLYILILDFNYLSSLFASLKLVNLILTRSHRTSLPHAQVSYLSALFPTELCFKLFPIQCCICILRASQRPLCDLLIFCITFVLVFVLWAIGVYSYSNVTWLYVNLSLFPRYSSWQFTKPLGIINQQRRLSGQHT